MTDRKMEIAARTSVLKNQMLRCTKIRDETLILMMEISQEMSELKRESDRLEKQNLT